MEYSDHNKYVLEQSLRLLRIAVDGLADDPRSLDHWFQARHCINSIAAVNLYYNPNHYGKLPTEDESFSDGKYTDF